MESTIEWTRSTREVRSSRILARFVAYRYASPQSVWNVPVAPRLGLTDSIPDDPKIHPHLREFATSLFTAPSPHKRLASKAKQTKETTSTSWSTSGSDTDSLPWVYTSISGKYKHIPLGPVKVVPLIYTA